jgi:hypothetical protein
MTEPWTRSNCPECGRASDNNRIVVQPHDGIETRKVHHSDHAGHTWTVGWVPEKAEVAG